MIREGGGHMSQGQPGIHGENLDDPGMGRHRVFHDYGLGSPVDGFGDIEVSICLMAFESNKDVARLNPAGMVSQSPDGNIFISRYINDIKPMKNMGEVFPRLLVLNRQGFAYKTFMK
jgi:hypothetical protein